MEIHETSPQAIAHGGGFVDSHWHLRKRHVLHSQTSGNLFHASQKTGHKPSNEADLIANAQTVQDSTLAGEKLQTYNKWQTML